MKIALTSMTGLLFLAACGEPDVVVVEPIEEEGVDQQVISGDGIEAHEQVETVVMPETSAEERALESEAGPSTQ